MSLKINTKYFGEVEYEESELLHFPKGLYSFEDEKDFLLLIFPGNGTLLSLQSVKTPELAFVAIDPFALYEGYAPQLQSAELKDLGVKDSTELFYYALCAVKSPPAYSTVNLRCPIAINNDTRQAMQVILEDENYGMRHLLCDVENQGEVTC